MCFFSCKQWKKICLKETFTKKRREEKEDMKVTVNKNVLNGSHAAERTWPGFSPTFLHISTHGAQQEHQHIWTVVSS